jgi:hypothetical protein
MAKQFRRKGGKYIKATYIIPISITSSQNLFSRHSNVSFKMIKSVDRAHACIGNPLFSFHNKIYYIILIEYTHFS